MNTIVLSNVSVCITLQEIANILNDEGILFVDNIVDYLNSPYSKTVIIQVRYWQDTEQAYYINRNLRFNGETEIETKNGIFEAKIYEQQEITIVEPEVAFEPNPKDEELDAYLQQMREEDEAIWMNNYEKVSREDEMRRDESYLYLDLRNAFGEELAV